MFKSVYQGGAHVEVFSAQGKDPVSNWKLHGKTSAIRKEYDQDLRGFVYVMEGGSTVTRMQLPKNDRQHLALLQPFFVLQLCIPEAANVSVELCISDGGGSRRRIFLSSAHKETSSTPLHARVPLSSFPRGEWLNVCIDLAALVPKLFRGQQFKSVESVTVGGSCRLRRVFTLKTKPNISGDVPASCMIPHFTSQKIVLVPDETRVNNDDVLVNSDGGTPDTDKPSHVAFGTKIPIPDHILKSRMPSRSSDSSVTSALSVHSDSSIANRKDHKISTKRVLPKIQRKKVTPRTLPLESTELHNTVNNQVKTDSSKVTPQSTTVVYSPSAYADDNTSHMTSHDSLEDDTVDGDTQLAIDVLHSQSDPSILYHYSSHPHSAHRKSPNASNSLSSDRGPCMDDDFYSSGSGSSVGDATVEVSPSHVQRIKHQPKPPDQSDTIPNPTDSSPVPLLRLSQVYDWRQYQSDVTKVNGQQDGSPLDKEITPHHSIIVGTMDSDEDTSLSATMTGWNDRLLETPVHTSLDDTLERVTSPDTLTRSLEQPLLPTQNLHKQGEELSLEYDPCLNCFYDPKSAKYYQLK